ncbi:MAG: LptF/LptG family permease [Candidatus Aminicenantes bacterium]|nr:LptF/LptG family permease [Candidatus Aminicenantes bacterium]
MIKSFDRYILKEIISPFAIGLLVYTFTLLINQILVLSNVLISRGATTATILKILLYLLPDFLSFTIPMSTLMGVLAGLSRMSTDYEIVAFRTMGVNNFRILKPVMIFSVLAWLFSSWLIMYVAPESNYRFSKLYNQVVLSKAVSNIKPKMFYTGFPFYVLYFNEIDNLNGEWKGIFLYSMKQPNDDKIIVAKRGKFIQKIGQKESHIALSDAVIQGFKKKEPKKSYSQSFKFLREYIPELINIKQTRRSTQQSLPHLIETLRSEPDDLSVQIEFHNKFALPFTCIAFGFLALSLGISTKKGGKISGFIISLGIIFLYYTVITTARNMILKRILSPFLGMWLPNLFLILIGIILYFFTSKEKSIDWENMVSFFVKLKDRSAFKKQKVLFVLKIKKLKFRLFKILDIYVLKKLILAFFLILLSLLFIFSIITIVDLIDEVVKNKVEFTFLLHYVYYNIPEFISFIFPVSILTAVLLTFSLMSKSNEIIAVQVSGIGLHRLTLPAFVLGIIVSLFAFFIQENLTPTYNKKAVETLNVIRNITRQTDIELRKNWIIASNNEFFHYKYYNRRNNKFISFNVIRFNDDFELERRIFAGSAAWSGEKELHLKNGFERAFKENMPVDFVTFDSKKIGVKDGRSIFTKKISFSEFMNISELKRYINYLVRNKSDPTRYRAKLYYKYAFPFSSLVMVFIAIPFSFMMGNKGTLYGIGIAVGISMIFWGAIGMFSALGSSAILPPLLSAFAPLLLFGAVSFYLFINIKT